MSTLMLLYIRHDGRDALSSDVVAIDYFGLSGPEFRKRAPQLGFPSPPAPSGSKEWTISLLDLANYIDGKRTEATARMQQYYSDSVECGPDKRGILSG